MRTRRIVTAFLLLALLPLAGVSTFPSPASAGPYCGIRWGSLPKSAAQMSGAPLYDVRAGRHACFDRLVFDLYGVPTAGYSVQYVPAVYMDASGDLVPLRGGAYLQVVVRAPAYDLFGQTTFPRAGSTELVNVGGFRTFRQVAWAGTFEGLTTVGLGVRARLPFRVFTLLGPGGASRVVVDVAHQW